VPALKAAMEDLKAGRLQAGWEKLEHPGVIKEVFDGEALRERAVEQRLKALRAGKTSLMISPRHEEARKVASVVRERLKAEGAIGLENYPVSVLRRMDLGPESCRDLLHYVSGRVVGFHKRTAGGFKPGEKWTVRRTNCETVKLERDGKIREFKPSAKGKWDVLVSSTMEVSVRDQIRVTAGFMERKTCSRTTMLPGCGRSPIPSSCCMTGGECAGMVRTSIKASGLPLMQASAVRLTRLSCCRTALTRKPGMSAYRELEARCTSTRATRQSSVNR
jgi:hypothetical protein